MQNCVAGNSSYCCRGEGRGKQPPDSGCRRRRRRPERKSHQPLKLFCCHFRLHHWLLPVSHGAMCVSCPPPRQSSAQVAVSDCGPAAISQTNTSHLYVRIKQVPWRVDGIHTRHIDVMKSIRLCFQSYKCEPISVNEKVGFRIVSNNLFNLWCKQICSANCFK